MIPGYETYRDGERRCGRRSTAGSIGRRGKRLSERSAGCGVGAARAADPQASPGGRPRKTGMRTAINAILYLLRTGYPWRYPGSQS